MRTLVTGATGLVGNNVTRLLLARGQAVRVLVRSQSNLRTLEGLDIELAYGDVCDATAVREACRGVSAIIHSAAHLHIGWTNLEIARAVNVEGTRNVIAGARDEGVRMVHVSTVDTLGSGAPGRPADEQTQGEKPPCTYVVTKREAESEVLRAIEAGLDAVIVHPGFMLGPWDWKPSSGRMLLEVAQNFTPLAPSGGCSVCDVRDVAAGILEACSRGQTGRRYILAGANMTYYEFWRLLARVTGSWPPVARAWWIAQSVVGMGGDLVTRIRGREGDVNSAAVAMGQLHHFYSSERAMRELDYQCRPVEETVHDAWQWFQQYGYA